MMVLLFLAVVSTPVMTSASKTYLDCVERQAAQLEASGESAELIADVALTKCESLLPAVVDQLIADVRNSPEVRAFEEREHRPFIVDQNLRNDFWHDAKRLARQEALAAVVEARARRKRK